MISSIEFQKKAVTLTPTNHVFVVDVSGSMHQALTKIRQHLKNNLSMLVKPNDTVSVLYFSGQGQFGTVFVGQPINNIKDLSDIQNSIDKFLQPICLTGFIEPLQLAMDIIDDLPSQNMNSLLFLTDGYHNSGGGESEILSVCAKLPMYYSKIEFIEYGYYCNRPLMEKMASATNGIHSFVESYDFYEPLIEKSLSQEMAVMVPIEVGKATHAMYIHDGRVIINNAKDGKALIPENVYQVYAVGDETVDHLDGLDEELMFALLYYSVHVMNSELAWKVLKKLGDVRLIKAYDNCFTKQDYSNMKDLVQQAVVDATERFVDGINYDMVPNENAFTVIDVLECLVSNGAYLDLEALEYNRTGRKAVQSEDEEWKPHFQANAKTVSMTNLVYSSNRPNISIQTNISGTISIPEGIQCDYNLPDEIGSSIYRNYTVVKDGIINLKRLPVIAKKETLRDLETLGVDFDYEESEGTLFYITVMLDSVPLINRSMVKTVSGEELARKAVALQFLKAKQKVFKHYRDELVGKVNAVGLAQLYGTEAAKFLSSKGIRDYGFSPKSTLAESEDFYMSKELNIKIKSLSSLPSVNAVLKKLESGKKLTLSEEVINFAIEEYKTIMASPNILETLQVRTAEAIRFVRELEYSISKIMYSVIIGKIWFTDLDSDKKLVTQNGMSFEVTPVLEEKKYKI